jgi:hypothetical protein
MEHLNAIAVRYSLAERYGIRSQAGDVAQRLVGEVIAALHPGSDVEIGVLTAVRSQYQCWALAVLG